MSSGREGVTDIAMSSDDERHMRHALRLAARALGRVAPNPAVGCVIVAKDGSIAGLGWTSPGGRPHAETMALEQAGARAAGSTAYVTLEPCAHHGVTPPCTEALIQARVARVVAAVKDPDPRVNGRGFAKLRDAGTRTASGVCEAQARALNAGFFSRIERGRPLVALKSAETTDGFVAAVDPAQRWITSDAARRHGHLLRARFDAILVGINTVLCDDPLLTCRLEGLEDRSPLRIVLDSRLRLPLTSQLAKTARAIPVLVVTSAARGGEALRDAGVEILRADADAQGRPDLGATLKMLAGRGLTRLLVEGGSKVHRAFTVAGLVDLVYRYVAPHELGRGVPSGLTELLLEAERPGGKVERLSRLALGPDHLESYRVRV
jgi:diaminohydroxyphosphoribosylaminopyrimidine deaminase/5-amino-6-(5-phosphoribosylamino)uracil reductase